MSVLGMLWTVIMRGGMVEFVGNRWMELLDFGYGILKVNSSKAN